MDRIDITLSSSTDKLFAKERWVYDQVLDGDQKPRIKRKDIIDKFLKEIFKGEVIGQRFLAAVWAKFALIIYWMIAIKAV